MGNKISCVFEGEGIKFFNNLIEIFVVDVFYYDEVSIVILVDIVGLYNIWVLESG